MTISDWVGAVGYFVFALGIGQAATRMFRFPEDKLVHSWASYYLAGQVVLTLATLSTAFIPWSIRLLRYFLLGALVAYWLQELVRRPAGIRRIEAAIPMVGCVCLLILAFPSVFLVAQEVPLWEWDARSNWFFHGKSIFIAGRIDPGFFMNSLYDWSHHDYPLLIPSQSAWTALFLGEWNDYSDKAFLLFNFAAYVYLFFKACSSRGYPWWLAGFLTVLVFDQESYSYVSGYADNHYVIGIVLALFLAASSERLWRLPLIILLLSFAASVKNEGTVYVLLIVLFLIAVAIMRALWRRDASELRRWCTDRKRLIGWGLCLGFLPFALWQAFRWIYHIRNDLNLVSRLTDPALMAQLLHDRWRVVAGFIGDFYVTKGAYLVLVLILMLGLWRLHLRPRRPWPWLRVQGYEMFAWIIFGMAQIFIVIVYIATPSDVRLHLATSATRLQFFPYMILLLIFFHNADALLRGLLLEKESSASPSVDEFPGPQTGNGQGS